MADLKNKVIGIINESIDVKSLVVQNCTETIISTAEVLTGALKKGGKILLCGNGGSAADSQHIAAELVVRLRGNINRPAIPALALTVDTSILTAGGNDLGFEQVFARGVEAYGAEGDVLVAISTSGNSTNVINAVGQAREKRMHIVGLLGGNGGRLAPLCDLSVVIPSDVTARIQESHIMVGHIWCEIIEEHLYPEFFTAKK